MKIIHMHQKIFTRDMCLKGLRNPKKKLLFGKDTEWDFIEKNG
jgi:hypothetical protein